MPTNLNTEGKVNPNNKNRRKTSGPYFQDNKKAGSQSQKDVV